MTDAQRAAAILTAADEIRAAIAKLDGESSLSYEIKYSGSTAQTLAERIANASFDISILGPKATMRMKP